MSKMKYCACGKRVDFNSTCSCQESRRLQRNQYKKEYYQKNKESIKLLQSPRWKKLRKFIINRDNGYCQRCFYKFGIINDSSLQVHHIKPRVEYPELIFNEDNLICLCKTCNLQLGTNDELDFEPKEIDKEDFYFNL